MIAQTHSVMVNDRYDEQVYHVTWKKDVPIAATGLGLSLTHFLMHRDQSVDIDYILNLDRENINSFDGPATGKFSHAADKASDVFMFSSMAAPALLFLDSDIRRDWKEVTLIIFETYAIGMGIVSLTKNLIDRPRPAAFNKNLSLEERAQHGTTNSFISGHTASTALSTFMMAKIYTDYHPDSKWKPLIWTIATGVPLTTGMLRYKAGRHYITDVLAGFTVGALTGFLIPHMHTKIRTKRRAASTSIDYFGQEIEIMD